MLTVTYQELIHAPCRPPVLDCAAAWVLSRGNSARPAEWLSVSERTIHRDIADLSLYGVPAGDVAGIGYLMRGGFPNAASVACCRTGSALFLVRLRNRIEP